MIEATSATVKNFTSLSGRSPASIDCPLPRDLTASGRNLRISHARLQGKSRTEWCNPGEEGLLSPTAPAARAAALITQAQQITLPARRAPVRAGVRAREQEKQPLASPLSTGPPDLPDRNRAQTGGMWRAPGRSANPARDRPCVNAQNRAKP